MVFAAARFLVLIVLFFDFALAPVRFAGFPRMDLTGLRVVLPLRAAARFLRLAMTVACSGGAPVSLIAGVVLGGSINEHVDGECKYDRS
jgi:hypothetical protein